VPRAIDYEALQSALIQQTLRGKPIDSPAVPASAASPGRCGSKRGYVYFAEVPAISWRVDLVQPRPLCGLLFAGTAFGFSVAGRPVAPAVGGRWPLLLADSWAGKPAAPGDPLIPPGSPRCGCRPLKGHCR